MKLLLDEMWPPSLARRLRAAGYDVVAVSERADLRTGPAVSLLALAHAEGRAIVTENALDFIRVARRLQANGGSHSGLILTTDRAFPRAHRETYGRVLASLTRLLEDDPDLTNAELWF